jgi:DNA replicative helicase MCM subunit Mcm2 (Cdc46/Mcm family)
MEVTINDAEYLENFFEALDPDYDNDEMDAVVGQDEEEDDDGDKLFWQRYLSCARSIPMAEIKMSDEANLILDQYYRLYRKLYPERARNETDPAFMITTLIRVSMNICRCMHSLTVTEEYALLSIKLAEMSLRANVSGTISLMTLCSMGQQDQVPDMLGRHHDVSYEQASENDSALGPPPSHRAKSSEVCGCICNCVYVIGNLLIE